MKRFLSGDEALAEGVRLARPQVISAYPITPQTVVVERLSEMVESGELAAEYVHVESEHSALSCAIGASATGARTFTATSSQGLLYMAECLTYASGGRYPIVMMNANRSTALPWNIYGDQRDSLALLDHGWIQVYAENNQEALDLALMAYAVAEDARVRTPVMVNLDGFALTHTYETVDVPTSAQADAFLPPYDGAGNRFDFEHPVNIGFSAGPEYNRYFKYWEHRDMLDAPGVIDEVEARFAEVFGRAYPGMIECVNCEDANVVLVTLGSAAGLVRGVVAKLREQGVRAGMLRIRYLRPMPSALIAEALRGVRAVGVLEKDISFGAEGTVFTNVNSALHQAGVTSPTYNFIGGLGGDDISEAQVIGMFKVLLDASEGTIDLPRVSFLGIDSPVDAAAPSCHPERSAQREVEGSRSASATAAPKEAN
ncbi:MULTISPECIES: pyruvate ferredoxin oxidoreductase [Gordonibacter]|uniref:Pyruvate ferredoxin oxidoreductase n=1 Tax=Gordonibacter faecis TaxID=3047475 RepID=A0ABT7DL24_9ACTN|nr:MULTISPECIES: pyruvate ferredoxin oxidoreductase [unclassified Gordonibacter]MDJ1650230.1 pyruvate ferredoxin oxidoreductase [Gordonibacter sp. KGMB12511]HIW75937.1 pyruvate ferredoxin oxidoreductase [Candidatus Gordonibacter avicola]